MPFGSPFNLPFFYNNYKNLNHNTQKFPIQNNSTKKNVNSKKEENIPNQKASESYDASEAFFEIFGVKLYFDDILIICILFFLYTEKVKDPELFICLLLLLLS